MSEKEHLTSENFEEIDRNTFNDDTEYYRYDKRLETRTESGYVSIGKYEGEESEMIPYIAKNGALKRK